MSQASAPSLDLEQNNSTSPETAENGQSDESERYDCREVYSNFEFERTDVEVDDLDDRPTAPYRCGSWECYCCGYHMRQNLVSEIKRVTSERPELSRLLTLTLDPDKAPADQDEQHTYITERWNALRTAITREYGRFSYIWVREEQDNGLPHLHIIVSRYLPQDWVSRRWDELGGGEIVDIRQIENTDKAAHYVGKYLTKNALSGFPDGIRRYGSSQDITLDVRGDDDDSEGEWNLVMDDYSLAGLSGFDGPLRRGVANADFVQQRTWGGPVPPDLVDAPPDPPPDGN